MRVTRSGCLAENNIKSLALGNPLNEQLNEHRKKTLVGMEWFSFAKGADTEGR